MKTRKRDVSIIHVNGYDVLLIPTYNNTVHVEAVIKTGFVHEPKEFVGINHLLEHIMVSGWKKCKGSCNNYFNKNGCSINANTNESIMHYFIDGISEDLPMMIEYIATITTQCDFNNTVMKREKLAVMEELTESLLQSDYVIKNVFNQHFFLSDGLRYMDDSTLQMANLSNITLQDVENYYHRYTNNTMFFVVYGQYKNVRELFSRYIKPKEGEIPHSAVFTNDHSIIHVPFSKDSARMILAIPCDEVYSDMQFWFVIILHNLLFSELRTKMNLLYDISVNIINHENGCYLRMEVIVDEDKLKIVFNTLVHLLNHYTSFLVDPDMVDSVKKMVEYSYYNRGSILDHYITSHVYHQSILSRAGIISRLNSFHPRHFLQLCKKIIMMDRAMCVYQSKHKIDLAWTT